LFWSLKRETPALTCVEVVKRQEWWQVSVGRK